MKSKLLNWRILMSVMGLLVLVGPIAGASALSLCEKALVPSVIADGGSGAGGPPSLPPELGAGGASPDGQKFNLKQFVKENLKGDCLRSHPAAMANFRKSLAIAWGPQLGGWALTEMDKDDASKGKIRPPIDVLANTALLIWLQQELGCKNTLAGKTKNEKGSFSTQDGKKRYKDFLKLTPLGMVTFSGLRMLEDVFLYAVDGEGRETPWSTTQLKKMLSDGVIMGANEALWLFPRWAFLQTPFELKMIPQWHKAWSSYVSPRVSSLMLGNIKVLDPALLSHILDFMVYRIPLSLGDNIIFFKLRDFSENLFASFELPRFEIDGELFYGLPTFDPESVGSLILERIDELKKQNPDADPETPISTL